MYDFEVTSRATAKFHECWYVFRVMLKVIIHCDYGRTSRKVQPRQSGGLLSHIPGHTNSKNVGILIAEFRNCQPSSVFATIVHNHDLVKPSISFCDLTNVAYESSEGTHSVERGNNN